MQNAYAENQSTQLIGFVSLGPGDEVHVDRAPLHSRKVSQSAPTVGRSLVQMGAHPGSYAPGLALSARPSPPWRCVWMPAPAAGRKGRCVSSHAATNARKRPTVTS